MKLRSIEMVVRIVTSLVIASVAVAEIIDIPAFAEERSKEIHKEVKAQSGVPSTPATPAAPNTTGADDKSGLNLSDVEVVSANGSITRKRCPHSCADRGIKKADCKEWRSKMYPDVCYVEDLSKPSQAIAK